MATFGASPMPRSHHAADRFWPGGPPWIGYAKRKASERDRTRLIGTVAPRRWSKFRFPAGVEMGLGRSRKAETQESRSGADGVARAGLPAADKRNSRGKL